MDARGHTATSERPPVGEVGEVGAPAVRLEVPDGVELAALFAGPGVSLARLRHVIHARRLAGAESFTELLSLARLVGVERHGYQIETVHRVVRTLRGRALLSDEVGLGKTIEALMVLLEYQLRGMAKRVLVLAPPALVPQWVGELAAKAGIAARTLEREGDAVWRGDGVVVASLATARLQRTTAVVQAEPWDLVIVDEAHRVKRRGSASWKLVDGLRSRFLLLLTATPIETELEELYQLVTLLRPGQFATLAAFRKRFVDPASPTSPKNREALRELLGEVMVRNTRASCGLELPPRFVSTVVVDPAPDEQALYAAAIAALREVVEPRARRTAGLLLLEAGSSPAAVRGTIAKLEDPVFAAVAAAAAVVEETRKGSVLVDLVRAGGEAQVLVFTRYRATARWITGVLARARVSHVAVHGDLSGADKQTALAAFRAGEAQVLVSTDVGSEGHNLQHCHRLVNFDLPWNPMVIEQRIGRLHRFGQAHEVEVFNLCARGSMEERILGVLHDRVRLFELVVGEMDMVLGNLTDESELEERLLTLCATAATPAEIDDGLATLGDELLRARGRYDEVRELDQALFGEEFEA
ncbi:MAG: DEAD/DEAH box helicase [Myxococcota bacterium]|nr:DEAD/DEAH box helicase [Myxococcota bacterium]